MNSLEYSVVDALVSVSKELGRAEARIEDLLADGRAEFAAQVRREARDLDSTEGDGDARV